MSLPFCHTIALSFSLLIHILYTLSGFLIAPSPLRALHLPPSHHWHPFTFTSPFYTLNLPDSKGTFSFSHPPIVQYLSPSFYTLYTTAEKRGRSQVTNHLACNKVKRTTWERKNELALKLNMIVMQIHFFVVWSLNDKDNMDYTK